MPNSNDEFQEWFNRRLSDYEFIEDYQEYLKLKGPYELPPGDAQLTFKQWALFLWNQCSYFQAFLPPEEAN